MLEMPMFRLLRALFGGLTLLILLMPDWVQAQGVVSQGGAVEIGHLAVWSGTRVIEDGGSAAGSGTNIGISELLQVNPTTNPGLGPDGTHSCLSDGTAFGPYHALCFDANALGGGLLSYGAYNGALALPFQVKINGVLTSFSGSVGTVTSVTCGAGLSGGTITTVGTCLIAGGAITNAMLAGGIDLTTKVTGTLPYSNGGTGATALTNHGVVVAGASALSTILPSTSGNVLTSDGTNWTSAAPTSANLTGPVTSIGNATAFATMTANAFLTGNGTALPNQVAITGLVLGGGASAPTAYAGSGTCAASNWITALSASGVKTCTQPANTDITGLGTMSTQNANAVAVTGGTVAGLTGLGIRDTSAAFDVILAGTSSTALSASYTLTLDMKNVAHTLALNATANTITFPNTASYTVIGSNDTGTVTNTMLTGSIASSKLVGTDITTVGALAAGSIANGFGSITTANPIVTTNATASTTTATGAVIVTGGLGVGGAIFSGAHTATNFTGPTVGVTNASFAAAGVVGETISASGGASNGTVTITIASPAVISDAGTCAANVVNLCISPGSVVNFTTTGTLPTGIVAGTNYYVIPAGFTAGTSYEISATPFGAAVNTSVSQSGTQTRVNSAIVTNGNSFTGAAVSLTAGDWDCRGNSIFSGTGINTVQASAITPTNNSFTGLLGFTEFVSDTSFTNGSVISPVGTAQINVSSTTIYYLIGNMGFSTGTGAYTGMLQCRRMR